MMRFGQITTRMLTILLCAAIPFGTAPVSQQTGSGNGPNQFNFRTKLFGGQNGEGPTVPGSGTNNLLSLSYASPITGKVGVALSASPTTTGTQGAVGFEIASGIMPPDLDVDPATGAIVGYPAAAGSYGPVTIRLTNGDGAVATGAATFQIVEPAISYPPTTTVAQNSNVTIAPTQSHISATNFTLIGSSPPAGMNFNAATGVFSGAPNTVGTHPINMVHASAPDGSVAFSSSFQIVVTAPAATASASMANLSGEVGTFLTGAPSSSGFTVAPTWTLSQAAPFGLSFDPSSGTLSGTPTSAGTAIGLTLTASGGGSSATTNAFSVTVAAPVATPVAAIATPLNGYVGQSLSATATAQDFASAPTWTVSAGTLPGGINLNPATGTISGSPTAPGATTGLRLMATAGAQSAQTNAFDITVLPASTLALSYPPATTLIRNLAGQTVAPSVTGATGAVSFAPTAGSVPAGMALDTGTGAITGAPTTVTTYPNIIVRATEASGGANSNAFSITVASATATSPGNQTASVGSPFGPATPTTNLPSPTWTLNNGTLPSGLTLNASTGAITGTPTGTAGVASGLVLRASQGVVSAVTSTFSITVIAPGISVPPDGTFNQGQPESYPFVPTGPTCPCTWTVGTGTLPDGLTLSPGGTLSGTPTGYGQQPPFTVIAVGSDGTTTVTSPEIVVNVTPAFTPQAPGGFVVGQNSNVAAFATNLPIGPSSPWIYVMAADSQRLPAGLAVGSLDSRIGAGTIGVADFQINGMGVARYSTTPRIGGVPGEAGTFTGLRMAALNKVTGEIFESPEFSITVAPAPGTPLILRPYPDSTIVLGYQASPATTAIALAVDASDPGPSTAGLGVGTDKLTIYPLNQAGAYGFIQTAYPPWCTAQAVNENKCGQYHSTMGPTTQDTASLVAYGYVGDRRYTAPGTYVERYVVSDTTNGTLQGPNGTRSGRTTIAEYTVKVFESRPVATPLPAPILTTVPGGTTGNFFGSGTLAAGSTLDFYYPGAPVFGGNLYFGCSYAQSGPLTLRIEAFLPDGTTYRVLDDHTTACGPGFRFTNAGNKGPFSAVANRYRLTIVSGNWSYDNSVISNMRM